MNRSLISTLISLIVSFFIFPFAIYAGTYKVTSSISTVDGTNFCDGGACTSEDSIIIEAGKRGSLKIKNFNGLGSYIKITNEDRNPDERVEIVQSNDKWPLVLENCHYIDLRGDGDDDSNFIKNCGIKVTHNSAMKGPAALTIKGSGSNIKVSYLELTNIGTGTNADGIKVGLGNEGELLLYHTLEIHHNYIHDIKYAGMYIGLDDAPGKPYLDNIKIHHNLLENIDAYGITLKRIHYSSVTPSEIFNNTVRNTGLNTTKNGLFKKGIGVSYFFGSYAKIYDNVIENTAGPGIKVARGDGHQVYSNKLVNNGTHDEENFGHGITVTTSATNSAIFNNKIINPKRYGIYVQGSSGLANRLYGNEVIDPGIGDYYAKTPEDMIVGDYSDGKTMKVKGVKVLN